MNVAGYVGVLRIGSWANTSTPLVWLSGVLSAASAAITLQGAGAAVASLVTLTQAIWSNTSSFSGCIEYSID
jgi:hypothetical protein